MSSEVKTAKVSESEKMWEEIRDLPIGVFALAGQRVSQHVVLVPCPGNELYLKLISTSVLPALEETLGSKFSVELGTGYVIVKRANDTAQVVKDALAKLST